LSGIASDGHFVRPHVVDPAELPADFRQAVLDSFPGSGDKSVPLDPGTWDTITNGMAAATTSGTAAAAHLEGVDFAGKTGTAQVVGGGDTHVKGGAKTPNSWFVGMVPRRNPEVAIVVLQEHGDWGANSALIASRIMVDYVNKKRTQDHNVLDRAGAPKPVEVGAVWSDPASAQQMARVHSGHFFLSAATSGQAAAAVAAGTLPIPSWLAASFVRFKEDLPKENTY
jgi:penicillin-binding protein 2